MADEKHTYDHPHPIMAADSVIVTLREGELCLLLVRRGHEPYENHWAIPGGFVNENEPLDEAAARELEEETGLSNVPLRQMRAYGDPGRDPRGWAVSIVYLALIDCRRHALKAGDDAREAEWFPITDLPPLAFDHDRIVEYAVRRLHDAVRPDGASDIIPPTYAAAERNTLTAALSELP